MTNTRPRSVSVVALLADIPTTGHLGDAQARRFAMHGDDIGAQSAAFVDFAAAALDNGYKVVALYPKWQSHRATRAISFARGAARTDHVAAVSVDLSPLTLSLLADQLAYLAPYLPSGLVAALVDELPNHMLAGAWLRSVHNLATIPISVKQHMSSYTPKASFLACCAPVRQVGRVKGGDPRPQIPAHPVDPVQILVAAPADADTGEFDARLAPALRPESMRSLPAQPLGATYWGSRKYVEFVALSAHPQALTYAVNAIRPTMCVWCREPVAARRCPFCGAANEPPAGRPPAYSRAQQLPPAPAPGAPPVIVAPNAAPPTSPLNPTPAAGPPPAPPTGPQPPTGPPDQRDRALAGPPPYGRPAAPRSPHHPQLRDGAP